MRRPIGAEWRRHGRRGRAVHAGHVGCDRRIGNPQFRIFRLRNTGLGKRNVRACESVKCPILERSNSRSHRLHYRVRPGLLRGAAGSVYGQRDGGSGRVMSLYPRVARLSPALSPLMHKISCNPQRCNPITRSGGVRDVLPGALRITQSGASARAFRCRWGQTPGCHRASASGGWRLAC